MKTLKQYAAEQKIHPSTAWRWYKAGKIPGAIETTAGIIIGDGATQGMLPPQGAMTRQISNPSFVPPESIELSTAALRTNQRTGEIIEDTDSRFLNIKNGISPFTVRTIDGESYYSISEAIELCRLCYYNFAVFQNVVNLMVEFANAPITLHGGEEETRNLLYEIFDAINLRSFQAQFFRELFRSCNIFIYRLEAPITGVSLKAPKRLNKVLLPIKYIILNPSSVLVKGSSNFLNPQIYKELSQHELLRLRNPADEQDAAFLQSLPKDIRERILKGNPSADSILIPIPNDKLLMVFYNKQDYEPFAVPFAYSVLDDINRKEEMKKMDAQICRTMQQIVLLVKTGYESKNGDYVVDPKIINELKNIFKSPTTSRTLVGDFTLDAQFIIPQIGDVLDPKKYEIIERDISAGLNNIITGTTSSERYANRSIAVSLFIERLNQARETFLLDFLQPEINRICKRLGIKTAPKGAFPDIKLTTEADYARIYLRLMELGILTPDEGIEAIKTNKLPYPEESVRHQEEFKKLRDSGLYTPLIGKVGDSANTNAGGRPPGSGRPQMTKTIRPMGSVADVERWRDKAIMARHIMQEVAAKELGNVTPAVETHLNNAWVSLLRSVDPSEWLSTAANFLDLPCNPDIPSCDVFKSWAEQSGTDIVTAALTMPINKTDAI